jgi:hypothetical protein
LIRSSWIVKLITKFTSYQGTQETFQQGEDQARVEAGGGGIALDDRRRAMSVDEAMDDDRNAARSISGGVVEWEFQQYLLQILVTPE